MGNEREITKVSAGRNKAVEFIRERPAWRMAFNFLAREILPTLFERGRGYAKREYERFVDDINKR